MAKHDSNGVLRQVERTLQVGIKYIVPIFFAHQRDQFVTRDAGVVDKNVNATKTFLDLFNEIFRPIKAGHIGLKTDNGLVIREFLCLRRILKIRKHHLSAFSRKRLYDGPPDTATPAADNCNLS